MRIRRIMAAALLCSILTSCGNEIFENGPETPEAETGEKQETSGTVTAEESSAIESVTEAVTAGYGEYEEFTVSGIIETSETGFPFVLKLDEPILIRDYSLSSDVLYFNWDPDNLSYGTGAICEYDGSTYPFDVFAHIGHHASVVGSFFNFRMGGDFVLIDPLVQCDLCGKEDCIAFDPFTKETDIEEDISWTFYKELCMYFTETYCFEDSGCFWWGSAALEIDPVNHTYLGEINEYNYSLNITKAKNLADELVKVFRIEQAAGSAYKLEVGLYFTEDNRLYFCSRK